MALSYATSTIVSDAFRQMELDPISSFAEDSEQAAAAAEQFPEAMNQCLERLDWSFASKFVELSEAPSLPTDDNLPYAYVRPVQARSSPAPCCQYGHALDQLDPHKIPCK